MIGLLDVPKGFKDVSGDDIYQRFLFVKMPRKKVVKAKKSETVENTGGGRPNNTRIKELVNVIETFNEDVHTEIFEMLKKYMSAKEFTANTNGVYINLCSLSDDVLIKLEQFVVFCKKNNEELLKREKEYDEVRKNLITDKSEIGESSDEISGSDSDAEGGGNKKSVLNVEGDSNIKVVADSGNVNEGGKSGGTGKVRKKRGESTKKNDIDLAGAKVALHKTKNKFSGLQAKIIKQHKVGNKGDFSAEGGVVIGESSSVHSGTSGDTKTSKSKSKNSNIKNKRAAAKRNVKKLMK